MSTHPVQNTNIFHSDQVHQPLTLTISCIQAFLKFYKAKADSFLQGCDLVIVIKVKSKRQRDSVKVFFYEIETIKNFGLEKLKQIRFKVFPNHS